MSAASRLGRTPLALWLALALGGAVLAAADVAAEDASPEGRSDLTRVPDPDELELIAGRCPSEYSKRASGSHGYERRGALCEGVYESPVSAAGFEVVSLLAGPLAFAAGDTIVVAAPRLGGGLAGKPLRVTAVALPARIYYRMDARLEPDDVLRWPAATGLVPLGLKASDIGMYGSVDGLAQRVYVPLLPRRSGSKRVDAANSLELVLRAGLDMERIAWRSFRAGEDPGPLTPRRHRWTAGEPIRIELRDAEPGVLHVELFLKPVGAEGWEEQELRIAVPDGYASSSLGE